MIRHLKDCYCELDEAVLKIWTTAVAGFAVRCDDCKYIIEGREEYLKSVFCCEWEEHAKAVFYNCKHCIDWRNELYRLDDDHHAPFDKTGDSLKEYTIRAIEGNDLGSEWKRTPNILQMYEGYRERMSRYRGVATGNWPLPKVDGVLGEKT